MAKSIAIVGGGLMGCLGALVLAERGHRVVLFERADRLLTRASAINEGKIHLGFTYGLDRSGATQRLMFGHGVNFRRRMETILGTSIGATILHEHGVYAMEAASLLTIEEASRHFSVIEEEYKAHLAAGGTCQRDRPMVEPVDQAIVQSTYGARVTAAFDVAEPSIDAAALCLLVKRAVEASSAIEIVTGTPVRRITNDVRPVVFGDGDHALGAFDIVLNAAWDGMPVLEERSGRAAGGYCLRAKAAFLVEVDAGMPAQAVTFTWGSFGDIVPHSRRLAYISWYPSCLMGFTTDLDRGAAWFDRMEREFDFRAAFDDSCAAFEALLPGLSFADRPVNAMAGAILARASTDIDDPGSALHRRSKFGIRRSGNVIALDTGKLTCAPGLALELADAVS